MTDQIPRSEPMASAEWFALYYEAKRLLEAERKNNDALRLKISIFEGELARTREDAQLHRNAYLGAEEQRKESERRAADARRAEQHNAQAVHERTEQLKAARLRADELEQRLQAMKEESGRAEG